MGTNKHTFSKALAFMRPTKARVARARPFAVEEILQQIHKLHGEVRRGLGRLVQATTTADDNGDDDNGTME